MVSPTYCRTWQHDLLLVKRKIVAIMVFYVHLFNYIKPHTNVYLVALSVPVHSPKAINVCTMNPVYFVLYLFRYIRFLKHVQTIMYVLIYMTQF